MATGTSSTQPTTSTSAGQTGTSTGLGQTAGTSTGPGQTEYRGTEAPLGSHGAAVDSSTRPGAGHIHEGMSEASIKSGVIGFGAGERQGHAALSSHQNPEANLDTNQIVGGGNAPGPTTADTSSQPSVLSSANPRT
jgi:hypothetical protein